MDSVERLLCIASYEKGQDFLRQCAEMGAKVTVLTLDRSRGAAWPRECLEELATMPAGLNREQILNTVSWMARGRRFDRVIALQDYYLETAAQIREHMRVPGMGATTAGCYRDKLAQRVIAGAFGYKVPDFCRVLNYDELRDFMARVPAPWILRPRVDSAIKASRGIENSEQLWRTLEALGDAQSHYILEQVMSGDVFYVDSIVSECEVKFSIVHRGTARSSLLEPGDGILTSFTVDRDSPEVRELTAINRALAPSFGMVRGVTHAEFLRSRTDGRFYFLEIRAKVGGSFMDKLVEAASGVNLWREWARLEVGDLRRAAYTPSESFDGHAGCVICLSQGTQLDLDAISHPSIVARVRKHNQAGLILRAASLERVQGLLDEFSALFRSRLTAAAQSSPVAVEQGIDESVAGT